MNQTRHELQVGLIVVATAIILTVGLIWLKQLRVGGQDENYAADFTMVTGLKVGDRVQVRGIRMGQVTDFSIRQNFVRVFFTLQEGVDLRDDAVVRLTTKGIVGEVLIEIDPGNGVAVQDGYVFTGYTPPTIEAIGDAASTTLDDISGLTQELQGLVVDLRDKDQVTETLDATRDALTQLEGAIADNRVGLRRLVDSAAAASQKLDAAIDDTTFTKSLRRADLAIAAADSALSDIRVTSELLRRVIKRVEAGEGTLGRLMTDESLYDHADSALISIGRLTDELRRNPKKYFKLSVVDF
jgi:phospholipid/cholesterol/gamma-HCH transport system substrate-binding protein